MSKFTNEEARLLRLFQSEANRRTEEEFARIFTENDSVRVAFINENRAFTDGRNIVVDPAEDKLFSDEKAIEETTKFLHLPPKSCTSWDALKLSARSQNIHECLHIIYTAFPNPALQDKRCTDKVRLMTLCDIGNILEDAYIEAVGAEVYDNAELFLKWGRVSRIFVSNPSEGTTRQRFREAGADMNSAARLIYILNYMATELLYPFIQLATPSEQIAEYINRIRPLYLAGSAAASPMERYDHSCQIFDILEELIPKSEEELDRTYLKSILSGGETHSPFRCSPKEFVSTGRIQTITRRLFTDLSGNPANFTVNLKNYTAFIEEAQTQYDIVISEENYNGVIIFIDGSELGAAAMHNGIKIIENHPKPDSNMAKAYFNLLKKNQTAINTCCSRLDRLLKAEREYMETKQLFGSGISSKDLGDVKKRYWFRKHTEQDIPDMAVLFMIDGSGSMLGERRGAAMTSCVILHEVLSRNNIEHAIVEHRAIYDKPEVEHNVLVDFQGRASEKYNILSISADEGTREGLSLLWGERYLAQKSTAEKKLMVVISDGLPAHASDGILYYPPVSTMDTHNAAEKIIRRGTKIIAVALSSTEYDCYDALKAIYPQVIDCSDLTHLTGQLFRIISRELER